ncbi:MAG: twin-arginine translocase TatA/TatE family subunit [Alphaproteobacteria bacterium]|nr:twin-arginine translocase TatA/TatE family subunit [Alphaproteobacteria bacterium]
MGSLSIWHWIIIIAVLMLVFGGKGKVSDLMGDVAKGIKSFKKGMADDDDSVKSLDASAEQAVNKAAEKTKS